VVGGLARLALGPAEPLELQHLELAAARARHPVTPLVALAEGRLDAAQAGDQGRRYQEHLAPRERARAREGQVDRIAFAVDVARIGVDLIEEQIAHGHRAQAHG
jgi:hypothetical protein